MKITINEKINEINEAKKNYEKLIDDFVNVEIDKIKNDINYFELFYNKDAWDIDIWYWHIYQINDEDIKNLKDFLSSEIEKNCQYMTENDKKNFLNQIKMNHSLATCDLFLFETIEEFFNKNKNFVIEVNSEYFQYLKNNPVELY
jgi:hypothetical protein